MKKILLAVAIAAVALLAAGASSGGDGRGPTALSDLPQFDNVEFITVCKFTHFAPDDPIVHYKMPGMSHHHSFFGNVTTNAFSTLSSLRKGATSCQRPEDTASYWAPTLLLTTSPYARRGRRLLPPQHARQGEAVSGGAEDRRRQRASRRSRRAMHVVFWNCSTDPTDPSMKIPSCATPSLHVHVRFPNCWDGKHLDSANHHSHMAYSAKGVCPKRYPVAVPQIMLIIQYPISNETPLQLASCGQISGHADFFNGWSPPELKRLVTTASTRSAPAARSPSARRRLRRRGLRRHLERRRRRGLGRSHWTGTRARRFASTCEGSSSARTGGASRPRCETTRLSGCSSSGRTIPERRSSECSRWTPPTSRQSSASDGERSRPGTSRRCRACCVCTSDGSGTFSGPGRLSKARFVRIELGRFSGYRAAGSVPRRFRYVTDHVLRLR